MTDICGDSQVFSFKCFIMSVFDNFEEFATLCLCVSLYLNNKVGSSMVSQNEILRATPYFGYNVLPSAIAIIPTKFVSYRVPGYELKSASGCITVGP